MRVFISILLFQFSLISLSKDIEPNTLTINSSATEGKSYKIKEITHTSLAPKPGSIITIETDSDVKCVIPLEKVIEVPVARDQTCAGCREKHDKLESHYAQMFLNSADPMIECDVTDGETVGFHFIGATTIDDKSMFTSYGMIFDVAVFSEGPFFKPEEEPNAFEEIMNDASDILLRFMF